MAIRLSFSTEKGVTMFSNEKLTMTMSPIAEVNDAGSLAVITLSDTSIVATISVDRHWGDELMMAAIFSNIAPHLYDSVRIRYTFTSRARLLRMSYSKSSFFETVMYTHANRIGFLSCLALPFSVDISTLLLTGPDATRLLSMFSEIYNAYPSPNFKLS